MPKVYGIVANPNSVTGPAGGRRANAADFYTGDSGQEEQAASALSRLAGVLNEAHQQALASRRASKVSGTLAAATQSLEEFGNYLKNGQTVDGNFVPPPDGDQMMEAYSQAVEEQKKLAKETFGKDEDAYALFEQKFTETHTRVGLAVQNEAIRRLKDEDIAEVQRTLDVSANLVASTGNKILKERQRFEALLTIKNAVRSGLISESDGFKWENQFETMIFESEALAQIRKDPWSVGQIIDKAPSAVDPVTRERYRKLADDEKVRQARERDAARAAQLQVEKLEREFRQGQMLQQAAELKLSGGYTMDWVRGNKDLIDPEDYEDMLHEAALNQGLADSLLKGASSGSRVVPSAQAAFESGQITKEQLGQITKASGEASQRFELVLLERERDAGTLTRARVDLAFVRGKLSEADHRRLMTDITMTEKSGLSPMRDLASYVESQTGGGIFGNDPKRAGAARHAFNSWVEHETAKNGAPPSYDDSEAKALEVVRSFRDRTTVKKVDTLASLKKERAAALLIGDRAKRRKILDEIEKRALALDEESGSK